MASATPVSHAYLSMRRLGRRLAVRLHSFLIGGSFAGFGHGTIIETPLRLSGESRIALGAGVFIGAGSWLQTVGEGPVALQIGDGTSMSGLCVLSRPSRFASDERSCSRATSTSPTTTTPSATRPDR